MKHIMSPAALAGIGLAIAVSLLAGLSANWIGVSLLGFDTSPISAIMMAIIVGMLIGNLLRLPAGMQTGLRFCASNVLQFGIMLLGIRLSLLGAGKFTLVALPFVVAAIAIALLAVGLVGRYMGLSKQLGGLIAIGTSICGCTAIVATAPIIKANEAEVSYSIVCITVFGVAAMLLYPLLAHQLFASQPELAGLFMGTAIHETAQVAGAGMMYEAQYAAPAALDIATVTKLVRNLCMIAIIPLVGVLYGSDRRAETGNRPPLLSLVPWFIVGFALMSALRTIGDAGDKAFGLIDTASWSDTVHFIRDAAERLLLIAMAAVGLTSMLAGIRSIGMRPFLLGLFAAVLVGGVSLVLIATFAGDLIRLLV